MPAIKRQKVHPITYELLRKLSDCDTYIECSKADAEQELNTRLSQGFKLLGRSWTGTIVLTKTMSNISYWVWIYGV